MTEYDFNFFGLTRKGNRKINQDNYLAFINNHGFLIVIIADGMGGHYGGEVASEIATQRTKNYLMDIDFTDLKDKKIKEIFLLSIKYTLDGMKKEAKKNHDLEEMGTTLNVNVFINETVYIFNIGDSRTSSITKKFVNSITIDQNLATLATRLDKYNNIENAKNILTSSLGPKKDLKIDLYKAKLNNSGFILVSTDGVHNYVSESELIQIANSFVEWEDTVDRIITSAYENGSNDNMTCVLVKYDPK